MGGFLFNLKNKVAKPKNDKRPLPIKKVVKSSNILLAEEDEAPKKQSIDAFNSAGALNGSKLVDQKEDLVIVPANLSTGLIKHGSSEASTSEASNSEEQDRKKVIEVTARESLLKGDVVENLQSLVLDLNGDAVNVRENTEQDYEDVPVEEFGAALLRGMGWDGKMAKGGNTDVSHRQRGLVLGIGSKLVGKELEQELMMKRGTKLSVPLKRKERETGQ